MSRIIRALALKTIPGLEFGMLVALALLAVPGFFALVTVMLEQVRPDLGVVQSATGLGRKGEKARAVLEGRRRRLDRGFVRRGFGGMLEADDIGARRNELHLDRATLLGDVEPGHSMDMGGVLPLGRGGGMGRDGQP